MLDHETKRKIDNARDILVGKVPDPKSQVEQITIALIYKFMDDMDKESEAWGGKATFFSVEYEKYAWSKIFDPRMGGHEMTALYGEAIEKMNHNPNIPQLFRDIFKNAYLPYRDPETLKSFLKQINEFIYDHSERLGDAYEYLLSIMSKQGDAGQFRTPRHIIDFIVAVIDPKKNETVLDPACGTAGFLISSYKHIMKSNMKNSPGDQLTPDEKSRLIKNFSGYDISPDMVRLSLVNLYLHGFSNPHILEYDTLTSEERWNETADVFLANPPFMSPKGGIRPHKRFSIQARRSEVLFVDYIAEHLNPNGRAGVIVPEGIIFQSGNAYKKLRKMLVENYLWAVVSLPAGIFQPYSGVKTSILFLDKSLAKRTKKILFVKVENDGYDLGAQRRPIGKDDLPEALKVIKAYLSPSAPLNKGGDEVGGIERATSKLAHLVEKTKIAESGDWNLSSERYRESLKIISNYEMVEIGDICEVERGASPRPINNFITDDLNGVNWVKIGDARLGDMYIRNTKNKITLKGAKKSRKVSPGDLILSNSMSYGRPYLLGIEGYIHDGWLALRNISINLNKEFLYHLLISDKVYKQFEQLATGGVVNNLNSSLVKSVLIPLPPLDIQKVIVEEIEGYQKIIDGARQVVDNYKPVIKIDPEWEMVELEKICLIKPPKSEISELDRNIDVSFVPMSDLNSKQIYFKPKETKKLGDVIKGYTYFKDNDILLAKITPCFENGKSGIAKDLVNNIGFGSTEFYVFRTKVIILSQWIYYFISNDKFIENGKNNMTGSAGQQRLTLDFVSTYKIPLPSLKTQKEIVTQIEAEQEIVDSNKKLVEIYEQKIKDKISEVWGE